MPFEFTPRDLMGGEPGFSFSGAGAGGGGGGAMPGSSLDINFAAGTWGANLGPNLVSNGTFDTDTAGWVLGFTGTVTWVAGRLRVTATGGGSSPRAVYTLTGLTIGAMYTVTATVADRSPSGNQSSIVVTTASTGSTSGQIAGSVVTATAPRTETFSFIATQATLYLALITYGTTAADYVEFDNVSVRQVNPQALGPEKIVNGSFATDISGWTVGVAGTATAVWSAGRAVLTSDGTNGANLDQSFATVAGQQYQVALESVSLSAGGYSFQIGTTQGTNNVATSGAQVALGIRTLSFVATTTTTWIRLRKDGTAGVWTVDNVSVREVSPPIERILTTTRASTGMAQRLDGSWLEFAANVPRITDRGLLVEEARTNLILWNGDLTNAGIWAKLAAGTGLPPVVTANAGMAPDGTATAARVEFKQGAGTAVADYSLIQQSYTAVVASVYTRSIWLKSYNSNSYQVSFREATVAGNGVIVTVTPQWQRFTVADTAVNASSVFQLIVRGTYGTSPDADVLVWMPQVELGAFATSPIKTTSAAVTRPADLVTIPPPVPWFNPAAGTFFADYTATPITGNSQGLWGVDDNTANERMILRQVSSGAVNMFVSDGGVLQVDVPITSSAIQKAAFAYAPNDFGLTMAGQVPVVDTSGTLPTVTFYRLGTGMNTGLLNGYLKRATYFPTRLPNAELQALTAA